MIGNLESEARLGVRQAVLGELGFLAEAAPHAWSSDNVETLVKFTKMPHHNPAMTTTALSVLASLTAAPALPRITLTPGNGCPYLVISKLYIIHIITAFVNNPLSHSICSIRLYSLRP